MANRAEHGDDDPREDQVHLVTSASKPHSEEMSERAKKYLISMAIRTVCVVLAIFVFDGWLRLVAIVGALVLPWVAVVIANAGPIRGDEEPEFIEVGPRQIAAGERPTVGARDGEAARDQADPSDDASASADGDPAASATMGQEPPRQRQPYAS